MNTQAIIYGFFWGFILCFTFGPAFFSLIQVSIDSTYKKGAIMAFGIVAADALLMFFAVFGTSFLPSIEYFDQIISLLGATLLLSMGIISLFSQRKQLIYPKSRMGNLVYYFSKGAFLNILNPANFLFVVSTCTYLKGVLKYNLDQIIMFFLASLSATLIAEVLISVYASKIKKIINVRKIEFINKIAGSVFVVIAIRMLWRQFSVMF
jgi:L-lysine exporter family protein LysE/ArgO